jgi:hypothetical protein
LGECADRAQSAVRLIELVSAVRNTLAAGADGFELLRITAGGKDRQRQAQAAAG